MRTFVRMAIRAALTTMAMALAGCQTGGVEERRKEVEGMGPERTLATLAGDYREYGLPVPGKPARLMRLERNWSSDGKGDAEAGLCFVLEGPDAKGNAVVLAGTTAVWVQEEQFVAIAGTAKDAEGMKPRLVSEPTQFKTDDQLVLAVQCEIRGYRALARVLLDRARVNQDQEKIRPLRERLAEVAWNHWCNVLNSPRTDAPTILRQLKRLLQRWPELAAEDDGHAERVEVQADLERAVKMPRAPAGTIAAKFEALLDVPTYWLNEGADERGVWGRPSTWQKGMDSPAVEDAIAAEGLAAVPVLLTYMEDKRITRSAYAHSGLGGTDFNRLGIRAEGYLVELSGLWTPGSPGVSKKDLERWWGQLRGHDERKYLVEHVLGRDTGVNKKRLAILRLRYPEELPGVYRRAAAAIKDTDDLSYDVTYVAWALHRANLPEAEKKSVLGEVGQQGAILARLSASWILKEMDGEQWEPVLAQLLDAMPGKSQEIAPKVAQQVMQQVWAARDQPVWEATGRLLARSDARQRVSILMDSVCCGAAPLAKDSFIAVARRYLEDESVPSEEGGNSKALSYEGLRPCDAAASVLGSVLKVAGRPDRSEVPGAAGLFGATNTTPPIDTKKWDLYRANVRAALKAYDNQRADEAKESRK